MYFVLTWTISYGQVADRARWQFRSCWTGSRFTGWRLTNSASADGNIQHVDGSIEINCRDNTRAIRPIEIRKDETGATPVTNTQRFALRSVIGPLAWVARATRPDLAYRVSTLQQRVTHGDRLRASVLELQGKLPMRGDWEEVARRSMLHVQYSDCRSLTDHLLSPRLKTNG